MIMKRLTWIFLACLLSVIFVSSCNIDEGGQGNAADGPLKSTAIYNKHDVKYRVEYLDRSGKKTKVESLFDDGTVNSVVHYRYDDRGNLVTMMDSTSSDFYFYTYDEQDQLIEERNETHGNLYIITSTYLDEEGVRIDSNHNTGYKSVYHLNEDAKVTRWIGLDDEGDTSRVEYSTYDEQGNQATFKAVEDGALVTRKAYRYDDDGKILEELTLDANGDVRDRYAYNYDESGRVNRLVRAGADEQVNYVIEYDYRKNSRITRSGVPGKLTYSGKEEYEYYSE